jgi:multiple sugar transport system ATP-binding protein
VSFLVLERIEKVYPDGTRAVHPVDLAVDEGEFIVLLGPSGCGKTTTLRMVAGLELPTGGRIRLAGEDVTALRPSQRDVGFVFQFYALYPHLTVHDNIAFPLAAVGMRRRERRQAVASVAERLGITSLLDRHPRQLSGGDQQRVSLARAMVRRPRIWLMDEPLGTLDADQRLAMREFIREQQLAAKITTLYVTHDQEEAMSLADRVVVMEAGRIRQAGEPSAVYDDPATRFVAEFVGSPGMNFIAGSIAADGAFRAVEGGAVLAAARGARPGPAVLGVRPEFVRPAEGGAAGTVLMQEYLGSARIAHLDCGFARIAMRLAAERTLAIGDRVAVGFDPAHARLFDPATGNRL